MSREMETYTQRLDNHQDVPQRLPGHMERRGGRRLRDQGKPSGVGHDGNLHQVSTYESYHMTCV